MSESASVAPRIEAQCPGSVNASLGVAAFFDMDNTILSASSGRLYLQYLYENGYLSRWQWIIIAGQVGLYLIGLIAFPHLMAQLMTQVADAEETEAQRISETWFQTTLRNYVANGARTRIEWHRDQGHHVAIVSASTPYVVEPVARDLGLTDAYLATRLEVVSGRFTGRVLEPACYGRNKLVLARAYATARQLDLTQSYFYSDSYHDLPLLEAVGHPVAVNPDRRLAQIAAIRGWPVVHFYNEKR